MKYVPNIIISFIGPSRLPLLVYITLFLSRPSIPHPISYFVTLFHANLFITFHLFFCLLILSVCPSLSPSTCRSLLSLLLLSRVTNIYPRRMPLISSLVSSPSSIYPSPRISYSVCRSLTFLAFTCGKCRYMVLCLFFHPSICRLSLPLFSFSHVANVEPLQKSGPRW